jgi:histidinol-phosphate aminotransferase
MTRFSGAPSRRAFVATLGFAGAGAALSRLVSARGAEALAQSGAAATPRGTVIYLDSNENPNGPGPRALDAIRNALSLAHRYPYDEQDALRAAIARQHSVRAGEVLLGSGSAEVLRMSMQAFGFRARHLVTAAPTYEGPTRHATAFGVPIQAVPLDAALNLNLTAMEAAAQRAGIVYICNPNNPTGALLSASAIAALVDRLARSSSQTCVLIDEAYHDYVEDPSYRTAIPLAVSRRNVIVSRTFSKLHGMAGLRCGYAVGHAETIDVLTRFKLENSVNQLAIAAARVAIADRDRIERERRSNREAREYGRELFASIGYAAAPSVANFFLVDLRRNAAAFRAACDRAGVAVGRPFPPLNNHVRISIGTLDEMQRAGAVFKRVLS